MVCAFIRRVIFFRQYRVYAGDKKRTVVFVKFIFEFIVGKSGYLGIFLLERQGERSRNNSARFGRIVRFFVYVQKERQNRNGREKITLKWIVFITLAFVGNAGVSIVSRTQQMVYNGQHGNMLMFYGTMIAVAVSVVDYIREDKSEIALIDKKQCAYPVLAGVANFIVNLCGLYFVSTPLSTNVIYPVFGVGCLMLVTIASKFMFKEQMTKMQWLGIIIGAGAIALLSIVK